MITAKVLGGKACCGRDGCSEVFGAIRDGGLAVSPRWHWSDATQRWSQSPHNRTGEHEPRPRRPGESSVSGPGVDTGTVVEGRLARRTRGATVSALGFGDDAEFAGRRLALPTTILCPGCQTPQGVDGPP